MAESFTRYIIHHPEEGVFVGSALGLLFFSLCEWAGQTSICVFKSEEEAWELFKLVKLPFAHDTYQVSPLQTLSPDEATITDLLAAGYHWAVGNHPSLAH